MCACPCKARKMRQQAAQKPKEQQTAPKHQEPEKKENK